MKELSLVLMEGDTRIGKLRAAAKTNPSLQSVLADVEKNFYDVEKILRWHQFGTVEKLIAHNREVLNRIPASTQ